MTQTLYADNGNGFKPVFTAPSVSDTVSNHDVNFALNSIKSGIIYDRFKQCLPSPLFKVVGNVDVDDVDGQSDTPDKPKKHQSLENLTNQSRQKTK